MEKIKTDLDNLPIILSAEAEKAAIEVEIKNLELARQSTIAALQAAASARRLEEETQSAMVAAIDANLKLNKSILDLADSINKALLSATASSATATSAANGMIMTENLVKAVGTALQNNDLTSSENDFPTSITNATKSLSETVKEINKTVVATRRSASEITTLKTTVSQVLEEGRNAQRASIEAGRFTADAALKAVEKAAAASDEAAKEAALAAKLAAEDVSRRVVEAAALAQEAALAAGERIAAEAANKAKGSFLANMSHEIRTPLSAIIGFAEVVAEELKEESDPELRKHVDAISRNSKHLAALIDDILDISKIEAGRMQIEKMGTNIRQEVEDVTESLKGKASERGNKLIFTFKKNTPEYAVTDPMRLRQILINLIGNAIKFTENGQIEVIVGLSKDQKNEQPQLSLKIVDNGSGISPKEQVKLFDSYGQADRSISRRFGGTGLGLMLSRKLAQILGGDVDLVNSAPGKGSTFEVRLPVDGQKMNLSENAQNHKTKTLKSNDDLKGLKVLLAEDSADLQMLFKRIVTQKGAQVVIANNGEEAIEKGLSGNFDVIVMDIEMPVLDGNEATKTLRERGCRSPIVAFTAHALLDKEHFKNAVYDDYLRKPISGEHLIETLAKWRLTKPQAASLDHR